MAQPVRQCNVAVIAIRVTSCARVSEYPIGVCLRPRASFVKYPRGVYDCDQVELAACSARAVPEVRTVVASG